VHISVRSGLDPVEASTPGGDEMKVTVTVNDPVGLIEEVAVLSEGLDGVILRALLSRPAAVSCWEGTTAHFGIGTSVAVEGLGLRDSICFAEASGRVCILGVVRSRELRYLYRRKSLH
jgi:hypothetical protein